MSRAAGARRLARSADVDLRGASRVVGARAGRRQSVSDLSRAGRPARAVREGPGLHAHRAAAGDGASVLGLVGLPGARVLRADEPVRPARGLQAASWTRVIRRASASFSTGCPGHFPKDEHGLARLRRHGAVRARRPAAGRAPGLGHAHLQLRAERGPQLPAVERALLARGVPRRRPARRRRRVDAVPRLLAPRRASGFRIASAGARTSTRSSFSSS